MSATPEQLMNEEAAKALEAYRTNYPVALVHMANARRIADSLGLSARPEQREEQAA